MHQGDESEEAIRSLRALVLAGERYRQALSNHVSLGVTETQAVSCLTVHGDPGQNDSQPALVSAAAHLQHSWTALSGRGLRSGIRTQLIDVALWSGSPNAVRR